jgi:hypothetical protein
MKIHGRFENGNWWPCSFVVPNLRLTSDYAEATATQAAAEQLTKCSYPHGMNAGIPMYSR